MKHIVSFSQKKFIENICQKYDIRNYTINTDSTIDVNEHVVLHNKNLNEIPLQFGKINGVFNITHNNLTSLKNSPYYVNDIFACGYNKLTSLKYCPKYISDYFSFRANKIYSLDGIGNVENEIYYFSNPIEELVNIFNDDIKLYLEYLEVYNFQKEKVIYQTRFMEALNDIGIKELPELKIYIYQ